MSLRKPKVKMSVEEYLEWEKDGTVRHEYVDGEVYAMSGTSKRHNRVATNLTIQLSARLRGGPCQVYISDVKVFIQALNCFYYPDVVVACDPEDNDDYFVNRPVLVVEVESPSTSLIDRREKLMAYRKLESLREYVMLAQDSISAVVFHRDEKGEWWSEQLGPADELRLESVGLIVPLSTLYEGVDLAE